MRGERERSDVPTPLVVFVWVCFWAWCGAPPERLNPHCDKVTYHNHRMKPPHHTGKPLHLPPSGRDRTATRSRSATISPHPGEKIEARRRQAR